MLDGIGFGLDLFDGSGAQVEHEPGREHCATTGEGMFNDEPFVGASGLAEAIVESPDFESCLVEHLLRFQLGTDPSETDEGFHATRHMTEAYRSSGHSFRALVLSIIEDEHFAEILLP